MMALVAPSESFKQYQEAIEDLTTNAEIVQETVLLEILTINSNCEYLRKLLHVPSTGTGTGTGTLDTSTFKRVAPLIDSDDLRPSIERIAHGDKSPILIAHPVSHLFKSSGTSLGIQNRFISTEDDMKRRQLLNFVAEAVIRSSVEGLDDGKDLYFFFVKPDTWTAGGVLVRHSLTSRWKSPAMRRHLEIGNTSPVEVLLECEDVAQSTYCQLLCGLIQRHEVVRVGTVMASGMLQILQFLQTRWQELVEDIRSGSLSKSAVSDPEARKAMEALINGPDPSLAMQVEAECTTWQGIIRRLWPRAKYVACVVTGSMESYISRLEFFAGGLPLVSIAYGSSECTFGINLSPLCPPLEVSYTLFPNMAYFEFLPLDATAMVNESGDATSLDQSLLVNLVDVKLGQEYEIVVTTFTGLYRFRVGDVVKVTGFYNKAPQFRLLGRKKVLLSVDIDKTDDQTLQRAMQLAESELGKGGYQLLEYTSFGDLSKIPGHYVLFWEVGCSESGNCQTQCGQDIAMPDASVFKACCAAVEECFGLLYRQLRMHGSIGPLEIRVVRPGTFNALMNLCVANGASSSQYKTPRSVKQLTPMLDLLNNRVSHSFLSPNVCAEHTSQPEGITS